MIKKIKEFQWKRTLSKAISTIGVSTCAATVQSNCFGFLYEPEVPKELQEEME